MMNKQETIDEVKKIAPKGATIYTIIRKVTAQERLVTAYVFYADEEGRIMERRLNKDMANMEVVKLRGASTSSEEEEYMSIQGTGFKVAQEVAERLGQAVWGNDKAYKYRIL
jgi:hypothetical protein